MDIIDQTTFFNITQKFELIPFTQSKGMFDFHSVCGNNRIRFFVNNINQPSIACYGHEKKFLNKRMLLIEGECYATHFIYNSNDICLFYKEIINLGYDFIEVNSNDEYEFKYEKALRQVGFLRPVGQFSMPVTKIVDLTSEIKYSRNWRQNIKKSLRNNLTLETISDLKISDCDDFISIYTEMSKRKSLTEPLTVEQVYSLCKSDNFSLFFVLHNNKRVASIIIHKHITHAGSLYSANNKEALHLSASFFRHYALLSHLKQNGYLTFDLEKLVPSTESINNVFLFKDGIDGRYIQLNGEWSWYKKPYYRPLMYFVKKYLMHKKEF